MRHAIRSSRSTCIWLICCASHAVRSSKSRVYREPALAHGTPSYTSPQPGQYKRLSRHSITQRKPPRSSARQRLCSSSWRSWVWIRHDLGLEPVVVVVLVLVGPPRGEHPAGELETVFAEGLLLGEPVCVAAEVTLQVRPPHLALVGIEMAEAVPAVRDHDPGVARADQRVELLAVAMLGDLKERGGRGGRGPQRATLTAGPPSGLIDMHRALVQHPVLQLQVGASQCV